MKVGWLADESPYVGGAELTQAEFRSAAPKGAEIVNCPPHHVVPDLDRYVVHNHLTYTPADLRVVRGNVIRYCHDMRAQQLVGDHVGTLIFCSPLQRDRFRANGRSAVIPPPLDLDRFRKVAQSAQERTGAVAVGPWMNPGKAPHLAAEWAAGNGGIDFYGGGPFAPPGSQQVAYEDIPALLAKYRTFIHLPTVVEPFGRTVVEAWAAGCRVITNSLVGARYWITREPDKLETAAHDFWEVVTNGKG